MRVTRKRKAARTESNEPNDKKQKSDFEDAQVRELQEENEKIRAAADRNSVKMSKITRQNQDYLQQLKQIKEELDKERLETSRWQQKFEKLDQDFQNYRQNKEKNATTITVKTKSPKDRKRKTNDQSGVQF